MSQFSPISFIPWAASLLLVAVAFSPRQANGECGDYVTILNPKQTADQMPEPMSGHQSPKGPCHGPNCTKHVPTPFVPLPPNVNPSSETKAYVAGLADEADFDVDRIVPNSSTGGPIQRPNSIFHPPRG